MQIGLPGGSDDKESTCNLGDLGSIPGLRRCSGEGPDNPLQYSCLENPHGQRSLEGYGPWGGKESDMTERLSMHTGPKYHEQTFENRLTQSMMGVCKNLISVVPSPRKKDAPECRTRPGSAHRIYFGISDKQKLPGEVQQGFSSLLSKEVWTNLVSGHQWDVSLWVNRVSLDGLTWGEAPR